MKSLMCYTRMVGMRMPYVISRVDHSGVSGAAEFAIRAKQASSAAA